MKGRAAVRVRGEVNSEVIALKRGDSSVCANTTHNTTQTLWSLLQAEHTTLTTRILQQTLSSVVTTLVCYSLVYWASLYFVLFVLLLLLLSFRYYWQQQRSNVLLCLPGCSSRRRGSDQGMGGTRAHFSQTLPVPNHARSDCLSNRILFIAVVCCFARSPGTSEECTTHVQSQFLHTVYKTILTLNQ